MEKIQIGNNIRTRQTYAKFGQKFACNWANFLQFWANLDNSFGQLFCRFKQAYATLLDKFAVIQTGLGNFKLAQIIEETLLLTDSWINVVNNNCIGQFLP